MQTEIFSLISYLKLESRVNINGINNSFLLTNDYELINSYKKDDAFKLKFGSLNYHKLCDLPYFYTHINEIEKIGSIQVVIDQFSANCNSFLTGLWLVKDNSATLEFIITYSRETDVPSSFSGATSLASNSLSRFEDITFSMTELEQAEKYYHSLINIQNGLNLERANLEIHTDKILVGTSNVISYNKYDRLNRSIQFISYARTNLLLPLKVTLYISALESLFSVAKVELKFRLALMVAKYLSDDKIQQKEYFKDISTAYDIRSGFIHGGTVGKLKDGITIESVSQKIDAITRAAFSKALTIDVDKFTNEEELTKFNNDLLF